MKIILSVLVMIVLGWLASLFGAGIDKLEHRVRPLRGRAAYYGEAYRGKRMANGERFDPDARTCASFEFELGTILRVKSLRTGCTVVVTVTDHGPAKYLRRTIDLSERAFREIAPLAWGVIEVEIEVLAPAGEEEK